MAKMVQLADIFSKPEMSLIAAIMDYFHEQDIEYQPESLFHDVSMCFKLADATFHKETQSHPHLYLHRDPELKPYLEGLVAAGKRTFLITNAPFETVDKSMTYMAGGDWRQLFDIIIVQAGSVSDPELFAGSAGLDLQ